MSEKRSNLAIVTIPAVDPGERRAYIEWSTFARTPSMILAFIIRNMIYILNNQQPFVATFPTIFLLPALPLSHHCLSPQMGSALRV
jgi:hypothetical protein